MKNTNMDDNNMYGQGNQNTDQQSAYGQSYQQAYDQNRNYNQNYNQNYQQPYNQSYQPYGDLEEPVTIGDWMLTMLLLTIPCVNIVMICVWAFGSGTKKSKSNYFKAVLIWTAISIALSVLITIIFGATVLSILESAISSSL